MVNMDFVQAYKITSFPFKANFFCKFDKIVYAQRILQLTIKEPRYVYFMANKTALGL